jgi:shikimate dehydrogenase
LFKSSTNRRCKYKFTKKGKLKGYNTDYYGFKKSILPLLKPHHQRALILGTGGASKAIAFALEELVFHLPSFQGR